jgi:uncharacterized delta-60 repeat protein
MTDTYKILGQGSNFLRIDAPENGSTIVSNLRVNKSLGAPSTNTFDAFFVDSSASLSYKTKVDYNFPKSYYFPSTVVNSPFVNPLSSAMQPDGKLIVSGFFPLIDSTFYRIVRLNIDGTLDFSIPANPQVTTMALQPNGKILIGGYFTEVSDESKSYLARLNSDGTVDLSFSAVLNGGVTNMMLLSNGKILVTGDFTEVDEVARLGYALINSDGTLDSSFVLDPRPTSTPNAFAQQSDGKIIIGSNFIDSEGTYLNYYLYRFNLDGTLDEEFEPNVGGPIYSLAIQEDGKILIGGSGLNVEGVAVSTGTLIRLNSDGTLDTEFLPVFKSSAYTQPGYVTSMLLQEDGKILNVGSYTSVNGFPRRQISRLNSDGSLDTSFDHSIGQDPDFAGAVGIFVKIHIQENGDIIIVGDTTYFDEQPTSGIIKLVKKFFTDDRQNYIVKDKNFLENESGIFDINGIIIDSDMSLIIETETTTSVPTTIQCYGVEEQQYGV